MTRKTASRKKKTGKKLLLHWVTEEGFKVVPKICRPAKPRALKNYTILITAHKGTLSVTPPQ